MCKSPKCTKGIKKFIVKYVSKINIFHYIYILPFIKMHYQFIIGIVDSRKVGTIDMRLIQLKSGVRASPQLSVLMLADGRVVSVLGGHRLPGAVSQPFLAIGRTVQYFLFNPLELMAVEEFGNLMISKINADLSGLSLLCHIRGITNKYLCSLK